MDNNGVESREKDRDRRGRGGRGSRFSDADAPGSTGGSVNRDRSREGRNCRIYISNIPYDYRWQDLKDLFRRIVGSVEYVELFHDENGKARGCGIVEFKDPDNVEKAMEKMNRYEVNGRELVVKEDHGEQRDQYGRIIRDGPGGGRAGGSVDRGPDRGFSRRDEDRSSGRNNFNMMSNDFNNQQGNYNYYGLSASFLESLGITGPLHNKVFVANLDYKVDTKKLKQVFKLAGKVQSVDLSLDKDGNSRGFAVIEYDHPVEAVQAISMLDRQMLYDRRMTVRLDRIPDKSEGLKLPEGLGGVGIGLGPNGEPLKDVSRNLPNHNSQNNQSQMSNNMMSGGMGGNMGSSNMGMGNPNVGGMFGNNNAGVQPSPVAPVGPNKPLNSTSGLNLNNLNTSNLGALTNIVGGLGAALSNPLLTTSLNNLGLNLNNQGGGNDDSLPSSNPALSNNYSTGGGNNYSSGFGGSSSNFSSQAGGTGGGGGSFNSYNSSSGGVGGGGGVADNDYNAGNAIDMYGSSGGNNTGNVGSNVRKSDTIVIKNIPLSCTWQTLRDKFRDVGEVKFAEIRGNDVGVVRFFKERDAELAIALMDGSRMDGRTIKVTYF